MARHKADFKEPFMRSSGSGTTFGYTVECRCTYSQPLIVNDVAFDKEWREIQFGKGQVGIPPKKYAHHTQEHGLFDFMQAEALRWWFLAEVEASAPVGAACLETRLVKYRVEYTHKVQGVAAIGAQDFRGDVPADMLLGQTEAAE